jgi:hypothetical protein
MMETKSHSLEKEKALEVLHNFLDQFESSCNQHYQPNADEFKNILSENFLNSSNGKQIGKNAQDFLNRIQEEKKKYTHVEFCNLQDCLIADNKAIFHYDMNLTLLSGKKVLLNIMAIATIDNNRITQWSQVKGKRSFKFLMIRR